jgi:hypothetical protein
VDRAGDPRREASAADGDDHDVSRSEAARLLGELATERPPVPGDNVLVVEAGDEGSSPLSGDRERLVLGLVVRPASDLEGGSEGGDPRALHLRRRLGDHDQCLDPHRPRGRRDAEPVIPRRRGDHAAVGLLRAERR